MKGQAGCPARHPAFHYTSEGFRRTQLPWLRRPKHSLVMVSKR